MDSLGQAGFQDLSFRGVCSYTYLSHYPPSPLRKEGKIQALPRLALVYSLSRRSLSGGIE
jgi:hypothetical protein